jgi:hypothetical protein
MKEGPIFACQGTAENFSGIRSLDREQVIYLAIASSVEAATGLFLYVSVLTFFLASFGAPSWCIYLRLLHCCITRSLISISNATQTVHSLSFILISLKSHLIATCFGLTRPF